MTEVDKRFYEPWWERLTASYSKSQAIQNRTMAAFSDACHLREAGLREEHAEAEAAQRRAIHAQRMRDYRARKRRHERTD